MTAAPEALVLAAPAPPTASRERRVAPPGRSLSLGLSRSGQAPSAWRARRKSLCCSRDPSWARKGGPRSPGREAPLDAEGGWKGGQGESRRGAFFSPLLTIGERQDVLLAAQVGPPPGVREARGVSALGGDRGEAPARGGSPRGCIAVGLLVFEEGERERGREREACQRCVSMRQPRRSDGANTPRARARRGPGPWRAHVWAAEGRGC